MPVTYPTNALVTQDELKDSLRYALTGSSDSLANIAIRVTSMIEELAECDIVTRLTGVQKYTEWHDLAVPQGFVYVRHKPIREVISLQAGLPGTMFTFLAADFVFDAENGMIMLKRGAANPGAWRPPGFIDFPEDYFTRGLGTRVGAGFNAGVGAVYVEYKGGYLNTTTVPGVLKGVFNDIAARIYRAEENKSQGKAQEIAAGIGVATKFNQDYLSPEVLRVIQRFAYLGKTARRTVEVL